MADRAGGLDSRWPGVRRAAHRPRRILRLLLSRSASPPADLDLLLSPADGRVLVAGAALPGAPEGAWQQVSIFLSLMDVHVNRVPASGIVTKVLYRPGRFLIASRKEAATENERSEVWIDHGGKTVVARQIVGFLARRVVCRAKVGDKVLAGDRFGVMKFGFLWTCFCR
jgi:phosphatidylserine decarboxylase